MSSRLNAESRLAAEKKNLGLGDVALTVGLLEEMPEVDESLGRKDYNIAVLSQVLENAKNVTINGVDDKEGLERAKKFLYGLGKLNGRKDNWAEAVKAEANEFRKKVLDYEKALTIPIDKAKAFVKAEIDKIQAQIEFQQQEELRKQEERFNKRLNGFLELGMERVMEPIPGVIVPGKPGMLISDDGMRLSTGASLKAMLDAFMPTLEQVNKRKAIIEKRYNALKEAGAVFDDDGHAIIGEEKLVVAKAMLYMYDDQRFNELLGLVRQKGSAAPEKKLDVVPVGSDLDADAVDQDSLEFKHRHDAEEVRQIIAALQRIESVNMLSDIGKHGLQFFSPKVKELTAYLINGFKGLEKELSK